MDVFSSQSTIAGYWAVVEAAYLTTRLFPLLMTATGIVSPAHVLILGAGVAVFQATVTAKRLGAMVSFRFLLDLTLDFRPAVREQVESLGAEFMIV